MSVCSNRKTVVGIVLVCISWIITNHYFVYVWFFLMKGFSNTDKGIFLWDNILTDTNCLYMLHYLISVILIGKGIFQISLFQKKSGHMTGKKIFVMVVCVIYIVWSWTFSNKQLYIQGEFVSILITQFLFVSLCEELTFRVIVLQLLKKVKSRGAKTIFSALIFSCMHVLIMMPGGVFITEISTLKRLIMPFILGLILTTIFQYVESIFIVTCIHGTYNVIVSIVPTIYVNLICTSFIFVIVCFTSYILVRGRNKLRQKKA